MILSDTERHKANNGDEDDISSFKNRVVQMHTNGTLQTLIEVIFDAEQYPLLSVTENGVI